MANIQAAARTIRLDNEAACLDKQFQRRLSENEKPKRPSEICIIYLFLPKQLSRQSNFNLFKQSRAGIGSKW